MSTLDDLDVEKGWAKPLDRQGRLAHRLVEGLLQERWTSQAYWRHEGGVARLMEESLGDFDVPERPKMREKHVPEGWIRSDQDPTLVFNPQKGFIGKNKYGDPTRVPYRARRRHQTEHDCRFLDPVCPVCKAGREKRLI